MLIRESDINFYQDLYHSDDYLMHYGKLGMKWGRRKAVPQSSNGGNSGSQKKKMSAGKKAVIIGSSAVGTALAVYGGYKLSKYLKTKAGDKALSLGIKHLQSRDRNNNWVVEVFREQNQIISNVKKLEKGSTKMLLNI